VLDGYAVAENIHSRGRLDAESDATGVEVGAEPALRADGKRSS